MGVLRGTVQGLLAAARKKTAMVLSEGWVLVVRAREDGIRASSASEQGRRPPCES